MTAAHEALPTHPLRSRIGKRLIGLFLVCSVGPLLTLGLLGVTQVRSELLREARDRLQQAARFASTRLLDNLDQATEVTARIAARDPHSRLGRDAIDSHLIESIEPVRSSAVAGVLVTSGGRELRPRPELLRHVVAGRPGLVTEMVGGVARIQLLVAHPFAREGEFLGVLATLSNEQVWAADVASAFGLDLAVYDETGTRLSSTAEGDALLDAAILHEFDQSPTGGRFNARHAGAPVVGSYRLLPMQGRYARSWIVAQFQTEAAAFRALRRSERMFGSLVIATIAIAAWLGFLLLRRILRPLVQLTAATRRVAAQDFDVRAEIRSGDEFEDLGDAFDSMVAGIYLHMQERDRQERLLRQMRDAAVESAAKETRFLQNVTHELRTPMTSIRASAEILAQFGDDDPDARREFLDIITTETDHLARLIEDVLDIDKLESGAFSMRDESVDLERTLRDAIVSVQPVASLRDMQIQLHVDAQPHVRADADRLRQVWTNLLSNAIKFGSDGSAIRIRLEEAHGQVVVRVRDHGCGIAEEDLDAIFERFRQVGHDLTTNKPAGTGLGLPIVREIVTHLGGTITVQSRLGHGSTFTVRLPSVAGGAATAGSESTRTTRGVRT